MARETDSACRKCRREGMKLFLKGEKCYTDKCPVEKRAFAPGEHGFRRVKESEYSLQLREKQKTKRIYGILERQFKNYYLLAAKQRGVTGENLLKLLEMRLDNVVYRLGFVFSRKEARQGVNHGHFTVNGKVVNIPSAQLKQGDVVGVKKKKEEAARVLEATQAPLKPEVPPWLQADYKKLTGKVLRTPTKEEIETPVKEQLVVEFYSK